MKYKIVLLILLQLLIFGCEDVEVEDACTIKVMSTDGPFDGYYFEDDGSMHYFESDIISGNTSYYNYSKSFSSSPDSVTVYAKGTDTSATSITIYIYEDGELADSITVSQSTDSSGNDLKVVATITYTFTDEDE